MNERRIAVFIPCYNAAKTIGDTIRSVISAVQYIGFSVPIYVYDDHSTDNSLDVLRSLDTEGQALIIRTNAENLGERKTTNIAFEYFHKTFDWVLVIHADDIAKPKWLSETYSAICGAGENCFTVWSSFDGLDDATGKITPGDNSGMITTRVREESEIINYISRLYSSWHISGAAFNVEYYQKLNGFDVSMAQFGDTDFFVRGLQAGYQDIYLSKTLTYYRTVSLSVSAISNRTNRDIREIYVLIGKFGAQLPKSGLLKMYKTILRLGVRRTLKAARQGNTNMIWANTRVSFKAFYEYFFLFLIPHHARQ